MGRFHGEPRGGQRTARGLERKVMCVERGEMIGDVHELSFRDPNHFRAGELHAHYAFSESVAERCPKMATRTDVLEWIKYKFLFSRISNIFRVRLKAGTTILTVHPIRCLETTCHESLSLALCRKP